MGSARLFCRSLSVMLIMTAFAYVGYAEPFPDRRDVAQLMIAAGIWFCAGELGARNAR